MSDCNQCERTDQMSQGMHEAEIHRVSVQMKNGTPVIGVRTYNTVLMHDNTGRPDNRKESTSSKEEEEEDKPRVHNPVKNQSYRSSDKSNHEEKKSILNETM